MMVKKAVKKSTKKTAKKGISIGIAIGKPGKMPMSGGKMPGMMGNSKPKAMNPFDAMQNGMMSKGTSYKSAEKVTAAKEKAAKKKKVNPKSPKAIGAKTGKLLMQLAKKGK